MPLHWLYADRACGVGCGGGTGEATTRVGMLDLGRSFIASVARDPDAPAIVDGDLRLTYAQWYERISSLVASFDLIGLKSGDRAAASIARSETGRESCRLPGAPSGFARCRRDSASRIL